MYKAGRVAAAGTKLFAVLHGTTPLAQIAGVVSLGGPSMQAESNDVTELDPYEGTSTLPASPEFFKEFMATWRDSGSTEFTCNFTRAGYALLLTWYRRGNDIDFVIQIPNGDQIAFTGHITALGHTFENAKLVQAPISVKVTGAPAYTQGP
jgi:hypothetical protein